MYKLIASGFGSGYSPVAPGTAGAAVGCGVWYGLHLMWPMVFGGGGEWAGLLVLIVVFFFLGVKSANEVEEEWGHDAPRIVVDELVGMWIALLFVPLSWANMAVAFGLFRLFDIWKPLGIRRMEKLKGGLGVMMDDVVAGGYALAGVHLYLLFWKNIGFHFF